MANKERLGLLENENNGRVTLQDWIPCSILPASTQHKNKPLSNSNKFLEEEEMTVPVGVERPHRENWTKFASNNPFDEEKPITCHHQHVEGNKTHATVFPSWYTARQQTQVTHEQLFPQDNPFTEPGADVFNTFNDEIMSTFMINPVPPEMRHQTQKSSYDPFECKDVSRSASWFDPLGPSIAYSKPQSKGHEHFKDELQPLFQDEWKPAPVEKKSRFFFAGEPSYSPSSTDEYDKSSSYQSMQKISNISGVTTKKDAMANESEQKTKKKLLNPGSFVQKLPSQKKVPSIRPKHAKVSVKKIVNICPTNRTEALAELFRGTTMLKFPRTVMSFEAHFRFFQLVRGKTTMYLQWFSKRKSLKATTINIADMDRVLHGKRSYVYIRHKELSLAPCALSIIYNRNKSLDLVAKNVNESIMWNKCLTELIRRAQLGKSLMCIQKIFIKGLTYVDRNRPKREQKNMVVRANMLMERKIDVRVNKRNNTAVERFQKRVKKLLKLAKSGHVRNTYDHVNLMLSVAAIQDRLEELKVETRDSMDSSYSEHDIWRLNIDLECLEEKVQVLRKNKNFSLL